MRQDFVIPAGRILEKLDALLSKHEYAEAKKFLQDWLADAQAQGDDRGCLLLSNELMGLCRKLGEEAEAMAYAAGALEQIKKMEIEDTVEAATGYLNCATVYKAFGKAEEGLSLFERTREIYEKYLLATDEKLGGLYNNMALAMVDVQRFEEAQQLYEKALSVMQRIPHKEPEQAITYLNMASLAEARYGLEDGEKEIALWVEKAMERLEQGKNQTDGNYAFVCEKCAPVFGYYGYFVYENQLTERYRRIYERT